MRLGDAQVGTPEVVYKGIQTAIEAIPTPIPGMLAYATDLGKIGWYNGSSWTWGGSGGGLPIYTTDPVAPADGDSWLRDTTTDAGQTAGNIMGVLGLTYSGIVTITEIQLVVYRNGHKFSIQLSQE